MALDRLVWKLALDFVVLACGEYRIIDFVKHMFVRCVFILSLCCYVLEDQQFDNIIVRFFLIDDEF